MNGTCPSDLRLEHHLLEPEVAGISNHVTACARCTARLGQMRREAEVFEREVYPATVNAVAGAAAPAVTHFPRRRMLLGGPIAAAAALALALVLVLRARHAPGVALSVYVSAPGGSQLVRDGEEIPAAATLHFAVEPRAPCCLWVFSVNAGGEIARLYPPKGDDEWEVYAARRHELPTQLPLDGRPGPQRIFVVCTPKPVPWQTVKKATADGLTPGADALRELRAIRELPERSAQATVLLEKRP